MSTPTLDKATVQLVPKPNTTSPVWKNFSIEVDEKGKVKNDEEVVCQLCSKKVVTKGSNTSNLIAHLRVHHPLQYTNIHYILCILTNLINDAVKHYVPAYRGILYILDIVSKLSIPPSTIKRPPSPPTITQC